MTLRVYNTLKGKKEPFVPLKEGKVGMYVCGPTVYDVCHMGHARSAIIFDMIFRYLKFIGLHVTYVRNITDIDDKIIKRANDESVEFNVIAERYTKSFHDDMLDLGIKPPSYEPKATDHMADIIAIVERLIDKEMAYQVDGDVYFSVGSFADYGKLSGRKTDDLMAGARVEVDERKKNPLDFALWKSSKDNEPWWESPWGKGRPGWHIECSAMSGKLLGESFDIHGGGKDLIFPHHENEVAQSEGANDAPFAKYWIHNGFVTINEEKMSKSLGNFFTIRELLNRYHPEVIRFFLLANHYRSPIDYSDQNLKEAETALERIYSTLDSMGQLIGEGPVDGPGEDLKGPSEGEGLDAEAEEMISTLPERFREAMDDDFNSAKAIAAIFDSVRAMNRWINSPGFVKSPSAIHIISGALDTFSDCGEVLGVLETKPSDFLSEIKEKRSTDQQIDPEEVEALIAERRDARLAKDWAKADEVRDKLASMGVAIMDGAKGTSWEVQR